MPKTPSIEVKSQANKSLPIWATVLIFIAGLAIGFGAFWMIWTARMSKVVQNQNLPTPVANSNQPPTDVALPPTTTTSESNNYDETFNPKFVSAPYAASMTLDVDWNPVPQLLSENQAKELFVGMDLKSSYFKELFAGNLATSTALWEMGTVVSSGDLSKRTVYLWKHSQPSEIGGDSVVYNYIIEVPEYPGRLLLLSEDQLHATVDSVYFVPAPNLKLNIPPSGLSQEYVLTSGRRILKTEPFSSGFGGGGNEYLAEYIKDKAIALKKAGTTQDGHDVYFSEGDCLTVFGADGRTYSFVSVIGKPEDIKWNEGYSATSTYQPYQQGGCGFHACVDVMTGAQVGSNIIKAGVTAEGDLIYIPKNPASNDEFKKVYDSAWYAENKPSLEEFARQYPNAMFFWKDAFGRWIRYVRSDLQPQAECGKPVIYLYPTKTTPVSVSLPRFINVTVSEPTYPSRGWQTVAQPDGTLTMADGQQFGSLYWEGTGVGYVTPREGFVIKDGEQKIFLTETLAKYGLNAKESQEFMDFWLPMMTGTPYYRVSFLTETWSKAAPLYVNPKPDTNIRIFMDWQKLSAPISITQPKIVTPVRNGFTLVEWGGLLYK